MRAPLQWTPLLSLLSFPLILVFFLTAGCILKWWEALEWGYCYSEAPHKGHPLRTPGYN